MAFRSRDIGPDLRAAAALAVLVFALWAPWLLRARVPVPADQQGRMLPWAASLPQQAVTQWDALWWDGVAQFYPWRLQLHRWLGRGQWPLWNDRQLCGYPFIGNGQSAMFYPPNWLYAWVHPRSGMALSAALHFALAALLTLAFCRALGLATWPAAYAALAFSCGGFMVGWTPLPTLIDCAAWLPGCLLGVEWVLARRRFGVPMLAACVGLCTLAGHLQISAYVLLATAAYAAVRVIWCRRLAAIPALVASAALGVMLSLAQVLPSLELAGMSPRGAGAAGEGGFQFHSAAALQPVELKTLLWPDAMGSPARGDYRGLSVARGASYGERCGFVGLLTILLGIAALIWSPRPGKWAVALTALLVLWAAMAGPPARLLYFGVPKLGLAGGFNRLLCLYTFAAAVLGAVGLEAVTRKLSLSARPRATRAAPWLSPLALAVLAAELLPWAWRTMPSVSAQRLYARTEAVQRLEDLARPGDRVLAITPRAAWRLEECPQAVLPPNSATCFEGLQGVEGYDSLYPARFRRFAAEIEGDRPGHDGPEDCSPLANGNMILLQNPRSELLNLAGARWIVAREDSLPEPPGVLAARVDGLDIWRNDAALPRVFVLPQHADIQGANTLRGRLQGLAQMPRKPVAAKLEDCNRMACEVVGAPRAQVLAVTQTWYPGWRAWCGGREVPVLPLADTFQGVPLPPGWVGRALLAYVPATVTIGLFVMLLGAGCLAGLLSFTAGQREST